MSIYRGRTGNEVYLASLLYDAIEDQDLHPNFLSTRTRVFFALWCRLQIVKLIPEVRFVAGDTTPTNGKEAASICLLPIGCGTITRDTTSISIRTLLIDRTADPNLILPHKKISPFHLVIGNDCDKFALQVVELILQNGGNPNVQADDGLSPMHIAAAWGRHDILYLLLCCGGDPEIRDTNRMTPLHYAHDENHVDSYNLLKCFVSDKSAMFARRDDTAHPAIDLVLEKVLISNGCNVGEYRIVNEFKTDSIYDKNLENLPNSQNTTELVMNWFNSHDELIEISDSSGNERDFSDFNESDNDNTKDLTFRKVYKKKSKRKASIITIDDSSLSSSIPNDTQLSTSCGTKDFSRESGVLTLNYSEAGTYVTCTESVSPPIMEKNLFEITRDHALANRTTSSTDLSFVSVSEIYKYEDKAQGIVLYERRYIKSPLSSENGSIKSSNSIVTVRSSLPETLDYEDYDCDKIRKELTTLGYNPGPVTVTTKRIYLKKLTELKKRSPQNPDPTMKAMKSYSFELQKTLSGEHDWLKNLTAYRSLEDLVTKEFSNPDPRRKWREGLNKSSFTYLLLDPRVTNNLPLRSDNLQIKEIWEIFLSAIFYVGKGKRSRPYSHLYDAVNLYNKGTSHSDSKKLDTILEIWNDDCGVVCLHVFQNTIPVDAYTREAAIISALKLDNLCNLKSGDFYGRAATWTIKEKRMLGVFLLYKAMMIFIHEGERQLCPSDID